jgi:hypothetical protein
LYCTVICVVIVYCIVLFVISIDCNLCVCVICVCVYARRYKYEADNIYVKLALDDHGVYNGSDELAARAAANDLRHAIQYTLARVEGLHVPLHACADLAGLRLICTAKVPLSRSFVSDSGVIKIKKVGWWWGGGGGRETFDVYRSSG